MYSASKMAESETSSAKEIHEAEEVSKEFDVGRGRSVVVWGCGGAPVVGEPSVGISDSCSRSAASCCSNERQHLFGLLQRPASPKRFQLRVPVVEVGLIRLSRTAGRIGEQKRIFRNSSLQKQICPTIRAA